MSDENEIQACGRYVDPEGKVWVVQAFNPVTMKVRLQMAEPPERLVSIDELKAHFQLENDFIAARVKRETDEVRERLGKLGLLDKEGT